MQSESSHDHHKVRNVDFRHVRNIPVVLEAMLKAKLSMMPGELLSVYVQNILKLFTQLVVKYEGENDWEALETLDNMLLFKLPHLQYASHLEAQERVCNLLEIVRVVERRHGERLQVGAALVALLDGELNPVAAKAQRRVPVPEK